MKKYLLLLTVFFVFQNFASKAQNEPIKVNFNCLGSNLPNKQFVTQLRVHEIIKSGFQKGK